MRSYVHVFVSRKGYVMAYSNLRMKKDVGNYFAWGLATKSLNISKTNLGLKVLHNDF